MPGLPPKRHEVTFAMADVHGQHDLFQALHAAIRASLEARGFPSSLLVRLGDLVDRGPDSRACVDEAIDGLSDVGNLERRQLRGNHEELMLGCLYPGSAPTVQSFGSCLSTWMHKRNGGPDTLRSYGFDPVENLYMPPHVFCANAATKVPERHAAYLKGLPMMHETADFVFVHAGLDPGRPLSDQDPGDQLWIRGGFLDVDHDFGRLVVHGHTITRGGPHITGNRLNIDTGAFVTGILTCAVLTPGTREADFIVATRPLPERLFLDPLGHASEGWARWALAVCRADPSARILLAAPAGGALHQGLSGGGIAFEHVEGDGWQKLDIRRFGDQRRREGLHLCVTDMPEPFE